MGKGKGGRERSGARARCPRTRICVVSNDPLQRPNRDLKFVEEGREEERGRARLIGKRARSGDWVRD